VTSCSLKKKGTDVWEEPVASISYPEDENYRFLRSVNTFVVIATNPVEGMIRKGRFGRFLL
jgi:hypothetical protein